MMSVMVTTLLNTGWTKAKAIYKFKTCMTKKLKWLNVYELLINFHWTDWCRNHCSSSFYSYLIKMNVVVVNQCVAVEHQCRTSLSQMIRRQKHWSRIFYKFESVFLSLLNYFKIETQSGRQWSGFSCASYPVDLLADRARRKKGGRCISKSSLSSFSSWHPFLEKDWHRTSITMLADQACQ